MRVLNSRTDAMPGESQPYIRSFFMIILCLGNSWDIFGPLEDSGVPNPGYDNMLLIAPWLHLGFFFSFFFLLDFFFRFLMIFNTFLSAF